MGFDLGEHPITAVISSKTCASVSHACPRLAEFEARVAALAKLCSAEFAQLRS